MLMPSFVVVERIPLQQPELVPLYQVPPDLLCVFLDLVIVSPRGNPILYPRVPSVHKLMPGTRITGRHAVNQISFFVAHLLSLPRCRHGLVIEPAANLEIRN